jgi:6-phosphogluconolactonase
LKTNIKIFSTPEKIAEELAGDLSVQFKLSASDKKPYNLAVSGGETPRTLFSEMAKQKFNWEYIHFYWADERCVPPGSPESNYGMTKEYLFDKINIPQNNIHRIKGEDEPKKEAESYSNEILKNISIGNELPSFDCILLGIGDDGHTASIFPNQLHLLTSDKICEVAYHPVTNQKRITLTGKIINNAATVIYMVTGAKKANTVFEILKNNNKTYPASNINTNFGNLYWYLDKDAAMQLNDNKL